MDLKRRLVHFRIRDLHLPDVEKVLWELYADQLLQGRVIDVTPGRGDGEFYAVVKVENLQEPVVVAVSDVLGVLE